MIDWQTGGKKMWIRLIALVIAEVFLFTTFDFPFDSPKAHALPTEKLAPPLKLSKPEEAEKLIQEARGILTGETSKTFTQALPIEIVEDNLFEVVEGNPGNSSVESIAQYPSDKKIPALLLEINGKWVLFLLSALSIKDIPTEILDILDTGLVEEILKRGMPRPPTPDLDRVAISRQEIGPAVFPNLNLTFNLNAPKILRLGEEGDDLELLVSENLSKELPEWMLPVARAPTSAATSLSAIKFVFVNIKLIPPIQKAEAPADTRMPLSDHRLASPDEARRATQLGELAMTNLTSPAPISHKTVSPISQPTLTAIPLSLFQGAQVPGYEPIKPQTAEPLQEEVITAIVTPTDSVTTTPSTSLTLVLPLAANIQVLETAISTLPPQPTVTTTMPPSVVHPTSLTITSAPIPSETKGEPTLLALPAQPYAVAVSSRAIQAEGASVIPLDIKLQSPAAVTTELTPSLTTLSSSPSVTTLSHLVGGTMVISEPESPQSVTIPPVFSKTVITSTQTTGLAMAPIEQPVTTISPAKPLAVEVPAVTTAELTAMPEAVTPHKPRQVEVASPQTALAVSAQPQKPGVSLAAFTKGLIPKFAMVVPVAIFLALLNANSAFAWPGYEVLKGSGASFDTGLLIGPLLIGLTGLSLGVLKILYAHYKERKASPITMRLKTYTERESTPAWLEKERIEQENVRRELIRIMTESLFKLIIFIIIIQPSISPFSYFGIDFIHSLLHGVNLSQEVFYLGITLLIIEQLLWLACGLFALISEKLHFVYKPLARMSAFINGVSLIALFVFPDFKTAPLAAQLILAIIATISPLFSTYAHEYLGHALFARIVGVRVNDVKVNRFTGGGTTVIETKDLGSPTQISYWGKDFFINIAGIIAELSFAIVIIVLGLSLDSNLNLPIPLTWIILAIAVPIIISALESLLPVRYYDIDDAEWQSYDGLNIVKDIFMITKISLLGRSSDLKGRDSGISSKPSRSYLIGERGQSWVGLAIVLVVFAALFMVVGPAHLVNPIKDLAGKAAVFATLTTATLFSLWQVWIGLYIGALILYRVSYLAYLWLHNNILPVSPFDSYKGKPSPTRLDHGIRAFIMPTRLDLVIGVMLLAILGGWVGISLNLGNFNWAWDSLSSILSYSATLDTGSLKMAGFGGDSMLLNLFSAVVLLIFGTGKFNFKGIKEKLFHAWRTLRTHTSKLLARLRERAGKWEVSRFSDFLVSVLTKKQSDETPIGKGSSQVAIDKVVYVPAELSGFTAVDLGRVTIGGGNNYEFARHEVLTQLERAYQDRLKQIIGFVSSYIGEQPLEVNIIIEPVQVDKPSAWYQSSSNAIHIQVILLTNLVPLEYAYFIAYYNFVLRAYGKKEVLAEAKKFLDTKSEVREVVLYTYTAESIPVEPVENWMEEEVKERRDNRFGMLWDRVKRDGFSVDRRTQDEYFALLLEFRIDGKLMIAVQEELKELLPESIIEKIAWNKPKTNHVTFVGFEVSEDDNRERVAGEIEEMSREILPGALKPFEFQAEGIGIMPTGALFVPMIIDISTLREIERIRMLYKQRTERVIFFSNPYIAHATVGNVIDELNNEEINVLFEALDKIRRKAWGRFYVNKVNFSQAIFYRDRERDILESIKEFPVRKTLDEADVTKVLSLAASPLKGKLAILNWSVRILLAEQLLIHEGLHYLLAKLFGRETTGLIVTRERLGIGIRYRSPPAIEDKLIQITPAIINILIGIITLALFLISPDKSTYLPIIFIIISARALYTGLIELTNKGELYEVTQVIKQTLNKALEWFKKIWINRIGVLRSKEGKILPRDEVDTYLDYLDDKGKLTLFKSIDRLSARIGFKNLPVQSRYIYIRLLTCKEPEGKNQEEKDVILRMVEEAESINQEVKERIKYLAENPILGGLSFLNTGKEILLGLINTGNPNEYQNFNNNVPLEGLPRVLLIGATNPQLRVGQFLAPPLGLHRIASFLRAFGIEVEIYDPNLRILQGGHNLEELVTTNRYDIIGISMLDQTLSEDSRLLNRLRELSPDSIFVTGGQGAQFNREGLFSETGVDAVIAGWGEYPLLEMVLAHRVGAPSATQFSRIRGVYTRNDAGEMNEARGVIPYQMEDLRLVTLLHDSASVPYDEYWDYIDRYYGEEHLKAISHEKFIHTVRVYFESHCPMGCDFCSSTNQLRDAYANLTDEEKTQLQALGVRNRILLLPAEDCMRVIKDIIRKHKPRLGAIFFNDDNFALDIARNHKLCDLAGKDDEFQKSGVYTYCLLRTDNLMADPTLWNRMYKDLRMGMVLMGGESFDDEVLKDMDKKVTGGAKTNKEAILFALRAGMVVNATLIMLHPAVNTLAKLMNTIDSCAELTEQAISLNAEEKLIFRPNFYVEPFAGAAITGEKAKKMNWKIDAERYRVSPPQRAIEYIGDRSIEIQAALRKTVTYKHKWDRELLPEHVHALIIFLSLYKAADELILAYYEGSKLPDGIIKEDITGILDVEDIDKIQREIRKGIERLEGLIDKLMNKSKLITTSSLAASPFKGKLAILNWPVRILLAEQLLIHEGLHYLLAKLFGRETTGLIVTRERLGIGIRYHSPPDLKDKLIQKIPPIANILIGIITLALFLISPDKSTYLPIIFIIISSRALYTGLMEFTKQGELYTKKRSESFLLLAEQTALDAKIIAVDFGGTLVPTNNMDIIALDDFLIQCVSAMELLLASDDELNIYIVSGGRINEKIEQILELYPSFYMLRGRRFHINEQVADKGKLMREVLQETDLSESSLIAIGNDESTDKPMALAKGHFIKVYPHTQNISPTALEALNYILEVKSLAQYRRSKLEVAFNRLKGRVESILRNLFIRKDKNI